MTTNLIYNAMLKQVLFRYENRRQFAAAAIGALIGFIFLLSAVHYFIASRSLGEGDEILGSNILIAQRKVSKFDALSLGTNTFDATEIENLRNAGRPVLVGTTSVEVSELLSKMLQVKKIYAK